ncbi:bacillithiol system protein YtxJ [Lutibacter agarilyticus]|uniref:Bacillithiol system protein YtxJ n=1 Tax=Lutibacter agarilyticus TaxID=1109740 RepID=A0A238VH16_9FLAO|nr:bacillithiol system redox-active protein YtxJ [Lutibacter agarilyticus]SNR33680.1 bacillithiol system protein YtxJ [Lutibacter agarilyticus]
MSFLKNIFNSSDSNEKQPTINWIPLTKIMQLDEIMNASNKKPVLIFKHSTRCGISRMALKNFERSFDIENEQLAIYLLDLIQFRTISNEIASKFNVQHQSPQAIVVYQEKVVYNDSHYGISVEAIKKAI